MNIDKERQEISLVGRIISLEALLVVMAVLSLISGMIDGDPIRILCGTLIAAVLLLQFILKNTKFNHKGTKDIHDKLH
jgi:hypothetical protein